MSATRESHGERSVALLDAGVWLHYVEHGHDGSPLVFVHGGGKDHHYWRRQLAPFAEQHQVVAYSRRYAAPNHNAPIVPDYSATTDAEDLHELLRVLGLGPAHIVAASIGASAALFLAVRHPELVRSLVLAEPPLLGLAREEPGGVELLNAFLTGAFFPAGAAFRAGDDERGMAILMDAFVAPGALDTFPPARRHRVMRGARDWAAQTMSDAPFPELSPQAARAIAAPVLLLSGERTLPIHAMVDAQLERLLPDVRRVIIPGASHDMWADEPERCRVEALAFLARVESGDGAIWQDRA